MNEGQKDGERPPMCRAYLLRLWPVDDREPGWRASLRSVHTGEQQGFSSLEALFAHLRQETEERRKGV